MLPQLIQIGDFFIPTYGVLVTTGFLLGCGWPRGWQPRSGSNSDAVLNLGIYCALAGILGAKLLMLIVRLRLLPPEPRARSSRSPRCRPAASSRGD